MEFWARCSERGQAKAVNLIVWLLLIEELCIQIPEDQAIDEDKDQSRAAAEPG